MLSWDGVELRRIEAGTHPSLRGVKAWIGPKPFSMGAAVGGCPKPFVGGWRGRIWGENLKGMTSEEGEGGTNSWHGERTRGLWFECTEGV